MDKLILSEQEYYYLAKGLAVGSGIGILIGVFIDNIILGFSACSVIGITVSLGYSFYKEYKKKFKECK